VIEREQVLDARVQGQQSRLKDQGLIR
jgi:hypothetical protein